METAWEYETRWRRRWAKIGISLVVLNAALAATNVIVAISADTYPWVNYGAAALSSFFTWFSWHHLVRPNV